MAQPKMEAMNLFEVMKHRDNNRMITKTDLLAWSKRRFPRDEFVASPKFATWVDGGKGNYLKREMHKIFVALVSMDRMAQESQGAGYAGPRRSAGVGGAIPQGGGERQVAVGIDDPASCGNGTYHRLETGPESLGRGEGFRR